MLNRTVSEIVVAGLLEEMAKGVVPWGRPWLIIPKQNLTSKIPYRGINRLLLACDNENYYITFNQAKELGGSIKAGAKARQVIFWKLIEIHKEVEPDEHDTFPLLRYYRVFRLADTDGIERPVNGTEKPVVEPIEQFVGNTGAKIEFGGNHACYNVAEDYIQLPEMARFESSDHYYCTLFHELIHWSGHSSRLDRHNGDSFSAESYSKEELVAEIGSAMLCQYFGINLLKHSASYISSWLKRLQSDNNLLVSAASRAEKGLAFLKVQV